MSCPLCGARVGAREKSPAYPFCSERCRLVDLGAWLGESYRISGDDAEASSDGTPGATREAQEDEPTRGPRSKSSV